MRHPTPRPRGRSRGFSLIEVVIALVVFGIGVLSLVLCVPMASKKIGRAGQQTRASTLAARQAEELLMTPYFNNLLTPGNHSSANNPIDGSYYVKWAVVDSAPVVGCKRITITVSRWDVNNPGEAAVTIVTPQSG
jgi:prepilin-type N-terminal cleavage/methylation domain-containing protein